MARKTRRPRLTKNPKLAGARARKNVLESSEHIPAPEFPKLVADRKLDLVLPFKKKEKMI